MAANKSVDILVEFSRRRRRWVAGISAAIVLYALLGFLVAPWLVRNTAIDVVASQFDSTLGIEKLSINPFVLSLRIDGLELADPAGAPLAAADTIFINFQTSSLFRWAFTFAEVRLDAPEVFISRDRSGRLNLETLIVTEGDPPAGPAPEPAAAMPRLLIHDFAINAARIDWKDSLPPEAVETVLGPITVAVDRLSTLPEKSGQQTVVITTATEGTLSWTGSLQLNPLASTGHAAVTGSHFPLISAYVRHGTGLDIVDGLAAIDLDYSLAVGANGDVQASVSSLDLEFTGVRVNTFHAEPDAARQPRQLLELSRVALSGGSLHLPERSLGIAEISVDDAALDLVLLQGGEFDFASRKTADEIQPDAAPAPAGGPGPEWSVALDRFAVNNFALRLRDHTVEPAAEVGVEQVNLEVRNVSNQAGASFPTMLSMSALGGGEIQLAGSVTALPEPVAEFDITVNGLALAGAHPYLKPMLDVNLDSGSANLEGHFRHDSSEPLAFEADAEILDFLITESDEGTRLGSWERLSLDQVSLSLQARSLDIAEIRAAGLYGDIRIAADGSVNLGRVSRNGAGETEQVEAAADPGTGADAGAAFQATIGRVVIDNAAATFADESLPLPFAANIRGLNGELTTIATGSSEPSGIQLEGAVDEYGLVRVTGVVTPLDFARNTDMKVVFENVDVPKFSAYSIPFAGREISSGRLDLDLGYQVTDGRLLGDNKVVLRDFELGEKVPHPGAASLPLGLAVALLKDPSGKIAIDLPVRGELDDPEFGYGRVIAQALTNLVLKIVASPFALLGNLVGVEADELEYVNFQPGRADLTPPEIERVQKLTEALMLRPELRLEISGVIDRDVDSLALRSALVDERIESRIATAAGEESASASYADQRLAAVEAMYAEAASADPLALQALRQKHTLTETDAETRFDALAYAAELRRELIAAEPISEETLVSLARSRADNTRAGILVAEPALESRVLIVDLREEEATRGDEDVVRMKVNLSVGGAEQPAGDT